jgi:hypothetical protein
MSETLSTRREAMLAGVLAATVAGGARAAPATVTGHEHDWDFMVGDWRVHHRQLQGRLVGSTKWIEFGGSLRFWTTMGGLGNVDDNVIEKPGGTYRAVTVRGFDPKDGVWRIWWLDGRSPTTLDPPVMGGFKDGRGLFLGDDTLDGKPIKVRFLWTTGAEPTWEQAFSPDAGQTWETNWRMRMTRA